MPANYIDLFTERPGAPAAFDYSPSRWPAYEAALASPKTAAAAALSMPRSRPDNEHRRVRWNWGLMRVTAGVARLSVELAEVDAEVLAKSVAAVSKTARDAHAHIARHTDRLTDQDHAHHARELARAVANLCGTVSQPWDDMRSKWRSKQDTIDMHGTPRARILGLVNAVICRWLPAVQNVGSHLPAAERRAAAEAAEERLREFMRRMASLHAVAGTSVERERQQAWGYGALDAACIEVAAMVGYIKDLAARVVTDGSDGVDAGAAQEQRSRADAAMVDAMAALDTLAKERFRMLAALAWQHHRSDVVAMARRFPEFGVSPEVELVYHARRSRFLSC
jgi:hypothetical protein